MGEESGLLVVFLWGAGFGRGRSGTEAEFPAKHMGPPALIPEVFQDYLSSDFNHIFHSHFKDPYDQY